MRPAEGKLRVVFQTTKGRKVRFDNLGGDRNPWIVDADAGRIMAISHKERKVFVMGSVLEQLQEQLRHADRRA
jgi:hypothetical protein